MPFESFSHNETPKHRWIAMMAKSANVVQSPVTGWIVLVCSLAITLAAFWVSSEQVKIRAQQKFEYRAHEIQDAIHDRMMMYEQALKGAVGLFNLSNNVSRDEWRQYVESMNLKTRLPGIQGVGYSVFLKPSELASHIEKVRAEGFPDYTVLPEGPRENYSAIIYLEPFDWRNKRAFGYDMWSNEVRRDAMARARDLGEANTSGIITLVQETDEDVQKGFLMYLPHYSKNLVLTDKSPLQHVAVRREHFLGWVYAAFRANDLMEGILGSTDPGLNFAIYDGNEINSNAKLYSTKPHHFHKKGELLTFVSNVVLQGRQWTIKFEGSTETLLGSDQSRQPLYILIAGILINGMLLYVFISLHFVNLHRKKQTEELEIARKLGVRSLAEQTRLVEAIERESQTFFEIAPDALLVVSANGIIVRANQRAHDIFEYSAGELIGQNIDELVSVSFRESHAKLRSVYSQSPSARAMVGNKSFQAVRKSGVEFQVVVNLVPLEYQGQKHTVAAVHDVTQQRVAEIALAQAKEKAEIANQAKSEFLANMSHEIRTPLNAVLGSAQLLENTLPTPAQKKYVSMIRGSGESLLGIINDILDFSKVEAGKMEISCEPFDLDELLERLAMMMGVNAGEKDLQLEIYVAPTVNRKLLGDALRLQQVFINLTSNALKFTAKGGVKVCIEGDFDSVKGKQTLRCAVIDTGIGMTDEQQRKLFKAFSQTDTSITRQYGGTGLGLVISSRIIDLMDGQILVTSESGIGSTFEFTIVLEAMPLSVRSPFVLDKPFQLLLCSDHIGTVNSIKAITDYWGWGLTHYLPSELKNRNQLNAQKLEAVDFVVLDLDDNDIPVSQVQSILNEVGMGICPYVLLLSNSNRSQLLDIQFEGFNTSVVKPVCSANLADALNESYRAQHDGESLLVAKNDDRGHQISVQGVKVLLVEDNVLNQTIAIDLLADLGIDVTVANNGQEAIDSFVHAGDSFSVILMDIQMPVMDGLTATKLLKTQHQCQLPIVAMTAGVLESERKDYLAAGMDGFIAKPIDHSELYREICRCISIFGKNSDRLSTIARSKNASGGSVTAEAAFEKNDVNPLFVEQVVNQDKIALDVLNLNRLNDLTRGKSQRVARLCQSLQSVIESGVKALVDAEKAVSDGDLKQAKFTLHSLKGLAGNYGADQLHGHIKDVEAMIEDSQLANIDKELETLKQEMNSFISSAADWVEKNKSA